MNEIIIIKIKYFFSDFSTKNIESKEDIILEETESGKSVTSMPSAASLGSGKGSNKQQKKKKKGVRR